MWTCKELRMVKITLKKKNKVGELSITQFKTYYKATVIKTMCYQCNYIKYTNRSVEYNREQEINLHIHAQLIF